MENSDEMYSYILESKEVVRYIVENQNSIFGEALEFCKDKKIDEIYIVGSGTSYHAALAAKKVLEATVKIRVTVSYPIQFKDNELITDRSALVIGISHAGRSTSTIMALDHAHAAGLPTISMTAEKNRPISEHADQNVYIEIGEENVGPKTKGFIGSIATIMLFGLNLGASKGTIDNDTKNKIIDRMVATTDNIPAIAEETQQWYKRNREDLIKARRIIVVGYDNCLAAMMEGTLKLSEALRYSVIGYEQEEFMHGIYHGIDKDTYLIYIASKGDYFERCVRMKNYFEQERKSHNYLITYDHKYDDGTNLVYDFINDSMFEAMEYVVPFQVLARKLSFDIGIDCTVSDDPNFHKYMGSYTY